MVNEEDAIVKNRWFWAGGVLLFLLAAFPLVASGQKEGTVAPSATPVVSYMMYYVPGFEPRADSFYFAELERRLGIKIELHAFPNTDNVNKLNIMLASNEIYDVMSMTGAYANQYGPQGAFVDITKYMDKWPNLKTTLGIDTVPWIYKTKSLYFMPGSPAPYLAWGWVWNKAIADELKIAPPKTLDDWLAAWRKVKAAKPDVVPIVGRADQVLGMIMPIFGLAGYYSSAPYGLENGKLVSPWIQDRYKAYLTFMNTLYQERLLYQDFNTATGNDVQVHFKNGTAFTALEYSSRPLTDIGNPAYAAIDAPVGPFGDTGHMWIGLSSYWGTAIGNTAEKKGNVNAALSIWNLYYSRAGHELVSYGKEGDTFTKKADGTYAYTDKTKTAAADAKLSIQNYLMRDYALPFNGYTASGLRESILGLIAQGMPPENAKSYYYVGTKLAPLTPPFWLSADEEKKLADLEVNIKTYKDEWRLKFIVGREPMSKWDEYVAGMKKLGLDEAMAIADGGYKRYLDAVGKPRGYAPPIPAGPIDATGLKQLVGL